MVSIRSAMTRQGPASSFAIKYLSGRPIERVSFIDLPSTDTSANWPSIFLTEPGTSAQCGGENTVCGNVEAVCGFFKSSIRIEITPDLPTDPDTFPFFFFVGGDATRDGSGFLTSILPADVPLHRRDRLKSFIIGIKPWFTWGVLIINFT